MTSQSPITMGSAVAKPCAHTQSPITKACDHIDLTLEANAWISPELRSRMKSATEASRIWDDAASALILGETDRFDSLMKQHRAIRETWK